MSLFFKRDKTKPLTQKVKGFLFHGWSAYWCMTFPCHGKDCGFEFRTIRTEKIPRDRNYLDKDKYCTNHYKFES